MYRAFITTIGLARSITSTWWVLFLYLLPAAAYATAGASITPNEVYAEVLRIERETALIERSLEISGGARTTAVEANLLPRHSWAQATVVLTKISLFKHQRGMLAVLPTTIEPYRDLDPFYSWAQTQRILSEITILKKWLDISGESEPVAPVSGKRPVDSFNHLRQLSAEWTLLIGGGILPAHVYGEAIHLIEETRALLTHLGIIDSATPPPPTQRCHPPRFPGGCLCGTCRGPTPPKAGGNYAGGPQYFPQERRRGPR
ncbi:hypothetical protein CCP3SC15_770016 [Gammaproteobacteria bacterium]